MSESFKSIRHRHAPRTARQIEPNDILSSVVTFTSTVKNIALDPSSYPYPDLSRVSLTTWCNSANRSRVSEPSQPYAVSGNACPHGIAFEDTAAAEARRRVSFGSLPEGAGSRHPVARPVLETSRAVGCRRPRRGRLRGLRSAIGLPVHTRRFVRPKRIHDRPAGC